jgi:glycosyltransferase involved in cell wall biosynthesis
MKSIFVDAHVFDHGFEGSASFIQGIYLELVKQNPGAYKIFLGCTKPDRVMKSFDSNPAFEPIQYRSDNRYYRLLLDIPLAIKRVNPAFAHFQYFTPLIKTCPWIVTIHDVLFNDFPQYFPSNYTRIRNILFPISARRADLLTTVSDYSKSRIGHWYDINSDRIAIIPNGVNRIDLLTHAPETETVRQLMTHKGGYLLCVSRFEPRKNQVCLLDAFLRGQLWKRGLKLVFVGSKTLAAPEFDVMLSKAPSDALPFIEFLSNLPYSDIQHLCAQATASIYPSFAEGFGIPPLESSIYGTPSLCANTTAMSEFDFLSPFFFDPNKTIDLLEKLESVLSNPALARQNAAKAAQAIETRYSWASAAKILHNLIETGTEERLRINKN